MKKLMWAVFNTRHSKTPRSIHFSKWDARSSCRKDWDIKRVEVDFRSEVAYDIYHHEYKKI